MDTQLIERLRQAAERHFPEHGVLVAYAHGSRTFGTPRPDSDLDVGYYLYGYREGEQLAIKTEMLLADRLSREVGVDVDLRNLGPAPLEARGRVLEKGVRVFSGDDVERVALERELLSRYHDRKAEFQELRRLRLRHHAEEGLV